FRRQARRKIAAAGRRREHRAHVIRRMAGGEAAGACRRGSGEMTMRVEDLHPATSGRLMMIAAYATVDTAARALLDQNVGLLVVCGPEGEAVGVLSRLDLVRHLADGQARETLASLMT